MESLPSINLPQIPLSPQENQIKDPKLWNSFIGTQSKLKNYQAVLASYAQMESSRSLPCNFELSLVLKACGRLQAVEQGKKIHYGIRNTPLIDDLCVRTALIDFYCKCGLLEDARYLFDEMDNRDLVSWNAMISGYAQNGQPNEAVKIFHEMHSQNIRPDEFVMVGLMSACSQVGSLELAKWVDTFVSQSSINLDQVHVIAALIDMNAKCGNMERAMHLFEKMPKRDLISYCSMIQGLSINGSGAKAVGLFKQMQEEGLIPDTVAFTVVLTACSHAGLVEDGCRYFISMKNDYGINPSSDHYACMVDLLGRAGRLKEAYGLIKSMPMEPQAGAWGALLGACRLYGNIGLGEIVARHLFDLEPHNAGNFVLLSNIYADADRWSDVSVVRDKMKERGVRKVPGCSWI